MASNPPRGSYDNFQRRHRGCGDVLTKKKLDAHRGQCRNASYSCLDCMTHFHGSEYRAHTTCITEDEKYQGTLYKAPVKKTVKIVTPKHAFIQDGSDPDEVPTEVAEDLDKKQEKTPVVDNHAMDIDHTYETNGFSYGKDPVLLTGRKERPKVEYFTPSAADLESDIGKSTEKKRKRRKSHAEDSLVAAPPLHTGLTGGLTRLLVKRQNINEAAETPIKPSRKHRHRDSSIVERLEPRKKKHRENDPAERQLAVISLNPADEFKNLVTKGEDSINGMSFHKVLKRYRRKTDANDDDHLFRELRLRRNAQGEIVIF